MISHQKDWKQNLRYVLFGWLPPSLYLKIVPIYFKVFNAKRRSSNYRFSYLKKGKIVLYNEKEKLYFADHRRIDRYMYEKGIDRIKKLLTDKYCYAPCTIDDNDVVVEVGANIGEFTLIAANKAAKVYAFEPDPKCFDCLRVNVQSLKNVELFKYGVSDKNEKKTFYLSTEDADSSFIRPKNYTSSLELNSIRLDGWMQDLGITKIDFLKLEAEGAEMEVLIGLGKKIKHVKKISADGSPERFGKSTYNEIATYLTEKKFNVTIKGYQVYAWR